jgi:hypothetical protein
VTPHDLPERIARRVTVTDDGCWAYGDINKYSSVSWGDRMARVHRLAYHLLVDPSMPIWPQRHGDGITVLDHLCRRPGCINPAHLELVSQRENIARGYRVRPGRTSSYVGVSWSRQNRRWQAAIRAYGRQNPLGGFTTEMQAAEHYDAACVLLGLPTQNGTTPSAAALSATNDRLTRAQERAA